MNDHQAELFAATRAGIVDWLIGLARQTAAPEEIVGGLASHAWVEVLVPGGGWLGLDPTQARVVSDHHVRVAYGRDYGDVAPVRGVYRGHAGQRLSVDVRVRPAIDGSGCERLREPAGVAAAASPEPAPQ